MVNISPKILSQPLLRWFVLLYCFKIPVSRPSDTTLLFQLYTCTHHRKTLLTPLSRLFRLSVSSYLLCQHESQVLNSSYNLVNP